MTTYCFYHDDLDGKCSGAIVKKFVPSVVLYPINYGYEMPVSEFHKDDEIYMVDFCLQPFVKMIELSQKVGKVYWIDHHISAIQEYFKKKKFLNEKKFQAFVPQNLEGENKTLKAGCYLTWDFFQGVKNPDEFTIVPDVVWDISDYDIWRKTDDGFAMFYYMQTQEINPQKISFWDNLFNLNKLSMEYREILEKGKEIQKVIKKQNYDYVSNYSFPVKWEGLNFIVLNRFEANSSFYEDFCRGKDYDACMTFGINSSKKFSFSLYSLKDNVNVLPIAKKYGGGGHKKACGFQTSKIPLSLKSQMLE